MCVYNDFNCDFKIQNRLPSHQLANLAVDAMKSWSNETFNKQHQKKAKFVHGKYKMFSWSFFSDLVWECAGHVCNSFNLNEIGMYQLDRVCESISRLKIDLDFN